jgi:hypothetical protein
MLQIKPKEIHPLLAIEFGKTILIAIYKHPPQLSSEHLKAIGLYTIELCFSYLEKTPDAASSKSFVPDAVFFALSFSILVKSQQRQFTDKFAQLYGYSPTSFCIEQMHLPNFKEGYRAVFENTLKEKTHSRDMLFISIDALLPLSNKKQQDTLKKIKTIDNIYSINDEKALSYIKNLFLKINNTLFAQETKKRKREHEKEKTSFESVLTAIIPKRMKPSPSFFSVLEHCAHTIEKLTKKQLLSVTQSSSLMMKIKLAANETAVRNIHREMIKDFLAEPLEKDIKETLKNLKKETTYAYGYYRYHLLKIATTILNKVSNGESNLNSTQEFNLRDGEKPADLQIFKVSVHRLYRQMNKIKIFLDINQNDEEAFKNSQVVRPLEEQVADIETAIATYQQVISLIEKLNHNAEKIESKHLVFLKRNISDLIKSLLFYLKQNILFMDDFSDFQELKSHVYGNNIDRIFNAYRQLSMKEQFSFSDMQEIKSLQNDCKETLLYLEQNIQNFCKEKISFINRFLEFLSSSKTTFLSHSNQHEIQAISNIFIDFIELSNNCIKENLSILDLCTWDLEVLKQLDANVKHLLENVSSLNVSPFFTNSPPTTPSLEANPQQRSHYNPTGSS